MGLAPQLVEQIFDIVKALNEKEGVTFLLAEQNTNVALRFAHYGYILESGRVVMDGAAEDAPRKRRCEGVLSRRLRGRPEELPRRALLSAPEALVELDRALAEPGRTRSADGVVSRSERRSRGSRPTRPPGRARLRRPSALAEILVAAGPRPRNRHDRILRRARNPMTPRNARSAQFGSAARGALPTRSQRSPAIAARLEGVDIASLRDRAALARLPVLRKVGTDRAAGRGTPPFGGLTTKPAAMLPPCLHVAGPIFEPGGDAHDWWRFARVFMHAAGFPRRRHRPQLLRLSSDTRRHDVRERRESALGCDRDVPAGVGADGTAGGGDRSRFDRPLTSGTPDFLKVLLG